MVTFHHFTIPTWLAARGGWEAADAPETFSRFVTRSGAHLGDLIGWACTINELNLIGVRAYDVGTSSPGLKDNFVRHMAINEAMVRAHRLAVDALRSGPGDFPVGLTLSMDEMVADPGGETCSRRARDPRGQVLPGHRRGRFHRSPVLFASALRSRGPGSQRPGSACHPNGLRVLAAGGRALRPASGGDDRHTGASDREWDRHRGRRASGSAISPRSYVECGAPSTKA